MRLFIILLACVLLQSCQTTQKASTPYGQMGYLGGVRQEQLTKDTFRIVAAGNINTPKRVVEDYFMMKSAEVTQSQGGTHFIIMERHDDARALQTVQRGDSSALIIGNQAQISSSPSTVETGSRPLVTGVIKILKVSKGAKGPAKAQSASEIITYIGPRIKRGNTNAHKPLI